MAISLLTDSERRVFEEVNGTTRTKIEAALKKYKLDQIPSEIKAQVDALAREQAKRHAEGEKVKGAAKRGVMQFFKAIGWLD